MINNNQITVSLREILELREDRGASTLSRLFNKRVDDTANNQIEALDLNQAYGDNGDGNVYKAGRVHSTKDSFYEDALKSKVMSVRLGFDEEKSTNTFQESLQNSFTDKHTKTKLSLASLSISKYDRNDGILMESAENSFSSTDPSLDRQRRLQQLSKPMDRNIWKVAEPVRSERYNLAAASRSRSQSPTSRGSFKHFLKRNDEWDKQRHDSRERQRSDDQEIDKATQGNPRLVAKRSVKLAEIARFKELKKILRSSDDNASQPGASRRNSLPEGVEVGAPVFDRSRERGHELNADVNFSVFERLALRGKHEAIKNRHHSHRPFVAGTVNAKPTAPKRSPSPSMPGNSRRLERRRSRSADIGSDSMDGGSSKNYVRMKFSDIVDQSSQGSRGRSRAMSPATTPRERDSNSARKNVQRRMTEGLAASKARSKSREKERTKKQAFAERHGSPCERRVFQPELCAPKTDEIMRTRYSFEERMRRSVEDYMIRVEVCKRLYPTEVSIHARANSCNNNSANSTVNTPLHSGNGKNVSTSNNSGATSTNRKISRSVSTPRSSTRHVMDLLSPNYRTPGSGNATSVSGASGLNRSRSSSPGGREGFSFGRERRMLPPSFKVSDGPPGRGYRTRQLNTGITSPSPSSPPPPPPPTLGQTQLSMLSPDGGGDWNRADIIVDSSVV